MKLHLLLETKQHTVLYTAVALKTALKWLKTERVKASTLKRFDVPDSELEQADIRAMNFVVKMLMQKAGKRKASSRGWGTTKMKLTEFQLKNAPVAPRLSMLDQKTLKQLDSNIKTSVVKKKTKTVEEMNGRKYSETFRNTVIKKKFLKALKSGDKKTAQMMVDNGYKLTSDIIHGLISRYPIKSTITLNSLDWNFDSNIAGNNHRYGDTSQGALFMKAIYKQFIVRDGNHISFSDYGDWYDVAELKLRNKEFSKLFKVRDVYKDHEGVIDRYLNFYNLKLEHWELTKLNTLYEADYLSKGAVEDILKLRGPRILKEFTRFKKQKKLQQFRDNIESIKSSPLYNMWVDAIPSADKEMILKVPRDKIVF